MLLAGSAARADDLSGPALAGWNGCFVGGQAGYVLSHTATSSVNKPGAEFGGETDQGALLGVEAGCDVQRGSWVVGIGATAGGGSVDGSHVIPTFPRFTSMNSMPFIATATLRSGVVVRRDWLVYARGGGAWARDDITVIGTTPILGLSESASDDRFGWIAGGGAEWRFLGSWATFLEYDYIDLGRKTVAFTPAPGATSDTPDILSIDRTVQTVRLGLVYRFGW